MPMSCGASAWVDELSSRVGQRPSTLVFQAKQRCGSVKKQRTSPLQRQLSSVVIWSWKATNNGLQLERYHYDLLILMLSRNIEYDYHFFLLLWLDMVSIVVDMQIFEKCLRTKCQKKSTLLECLKMETSQTDLQNQITS